MVYLRVQRITYHLTTTVLITFTETKGGTELGTKLDMSATRLDEADFGQTTGSVHLVGTLTLNYVKVRCVADIELATLKGTDHLEILDS